MKTNPLAGFSIEEMQAEIARRGIDGDEIMPCDTCQFFRPGSDPAKLCRHKHLLAFKQPETGDPDSELWGFYRVGGCGDFVLSR